jgi:hypothetical protein
MLEIMSDTRHLSHSSLVNSEFGRFSLMLLESDVNYFSTWMNRAGANQSETLTSLEYPFPCFSRFEQFAPLSCLY